MLTDGRVQAAGAGIAPGPRAQLCPPAVAGRGRVCPLGLSPPRTTWWGDRAGAGPGICYAGAIFFLTYCIISYSVSVLIRDTGYKIRYDTRRTTWHEKGFLTNRWRR